MLAAWKTSKRNSIELSVNVQVNIVRARVALQSFPPPAFADAGVGRASVKSFGRDLRQAAKRTGRARMRYISIKPQTPTNSTQLVMDDDLTATVHSALTALNPARKAQFLLETALSLIDAGRSALLMFSIPRSVFLTVVVCRYGAEVEKYLDVYLKTPDLPKTQVAQALLARANARKAAGDELLTQAHQGLPRFLLCCPSSSLFADFQAVLRLDPSNRQVAHQIRRRTVCSFFFHSFLFYSPGFCSKSILHTTRPLTALPSKSGPESQTTSPATTCDPGSISPPSIVPSPSTTSSTPSISISAKTNPKTSIAHWTSLTVSNPTGPLPFSSNASEFTGHMKKANYSTSCSEFFEPLYPNS